MKILFYTIPFVDVHTDTLFDGLCQVVGSENIDDYPHKPLLHEHIEMRYPSSYTYPVNRTDAEKLDLLRNGQYDLVIAAVRPIRAIVHAVRRDPLEASIKALDIIVKNNLKNTPIVLVDGCDMTYLEQLAIDITNPLIYFKREYHPDVEYPDFVKPLSLSLSNSLCPSDISGPRENRIFWAGKWTDTRRPFLTLVNAYNYHKSYDQYCLILKSVQIGLSLWGYGQDTVRYYEVPAMGALLLAQRTTIKLDHAFEDGKTAVLFDTTEEMMEKLKYCLSNPEYTDKIRLAGHAWLHKYHTASARAKQLLAKVKKQQNLNKKI